MPVNNVQKIAVLDITANTQSVIENYLAQGYVIEMIVSLTPTYTKLLIVYATPDEI